MNKLVIFMTKAVWFLLSCVIGFMILDVSFRLLDLYSHYDEDPIWGFLVGTMLLGMLIICIAERGFMVINKLMNK